MPVSILGLFQSFIPGFRLVDGGELATLASQGFSATSAVAASATSTQAAATQLSSAINEISSATTNGAVALPLGLPGAKVAIINDTAVTIKVYGYALNPNTGVGDTIAANNSTTQQNTTTGVSQSASTIAEYFCFAAGQWKQMLTG